MLVFRRSRNLLFGPMLFRCGLGTHWGPRLKIDACLHFAFVRPGSRLAVSFAVSIYSSRLKINGVFALRLRSSRLKLHARLEIRLRLYRIFRDRCNHEENSSLLAYCWLPKGDRHGSPAHLRLPPRFKITEVFLHFAFVCCRRLKMIDMFMHFVFACCGSSLTAGLHFAFVRVS
jgi:hypothetical protein